MRIGELAALSGASVRSLRYYEEQGLLSARRSQSAQRVYDEDAIERVRLLCRLYAAGLTSTTIASLLPCVDTPSEAVTSKTLELMRREHSRVSDQITQLVATRNDLQYLIDAATTFFDSQRESLVLPSHAAAS